MRRPYSGDLPITSEYGNRQFWLNGKLVSDFHTGIDIGGIFKVKTAESGTVIAAFKGGRVDANPNANTPANYIIIDHGNGIKTYYWHLSSVDVKVGQKVEREQVIGISGKTGYATGNHLHFAVLVNGAYKNPRDLINFSTDNNLPINNNNMSDEFITVGNGWGLSNVAASAGLPTTEATYQAIYNLNKGHRGSWDWQSLNARMGAGDVLRIKAPKLSTTIPTSSSEIKVLQDKIDKLNKDQIAADKAAKEKYEELVLLAAEQKTLKDKEILELKEAKRLEAEELARKLEQAKLEYEELEKSSIQINVEGFTDQLAAHLTTAAVEELSARGLKEKWAAWVDTHFASNFLRQLLKYTWPAWVFFFLVAAVAWATVFKTDGTTLSNILAGIVPIISTLGVAGVQYLLTNYDKNKDGKVDFRDFSDQLK